MRGKNYLGDISLDDIAVKDGFCPPLKECAFEETGLCGWSDEKRYFCQTVVSLLSTSGPIIAITFLCC